MPFGALFWRLTAVMDNLGTREASYDDLVATAESSTAVQQRLAFEPAAAAAFATHR